MSKKHTLKRPRAGRKMDEFKLLSCEIREIKKNDVEFSDLFEQLLEERSKFITNKLSNKLTEIKNTKTETLENVFESKKKNFSELILTENKIPQNLL